MVGAKLANLQHGGQGGKLNGAIALLNPPPVTQKQAAEMLNIGVVGARMANLKKGGTGANQFKVADKPMGLSATPAVSITRAAELSGSSVKSIKRAKAIVDCGIPELQEMVATTSGRWSGQGWRI